MRPRIASASCWRGPLAGLGLALAVLLTACAPQGTTADFSVEERPLDEQELVEFDAHCREASRGQQAGPEIIPDDAELAVASKRGRLTFGIYRTANGGISDCNLMVGPPGAEHRGSGGVGLGPVELGPLDRRLEVFPGGGVASEEEGASGKFIYGRVSSDVDRVDVQLDGGQSVVARQEDGYFLAWWPQGCAGRAGSVSCIPNLVQVTALDSAGDVIGGWSPG